MDDFRESIFAALRMGDVGKVQKIIEETLAAGIEAMLIVDEGLVPAIRQMGDLFEKGEVFLPHLMRSAEAMKRGMILLTPHLSSRPARKTSQTTIILGTAEGDIHDIGKNIVSMLLSASGFTVIDLGTSVSTDRFLSAVEKTAADSLIIGVTSLLTTTMVQQRRLIESLRDKGIRDHVHVMIGGASVSGAWANEIGADGYGMNAQEAVRLATHFSRQHTDHGEVRS